MPAGRPRLYSDDSERLYASVPASLAQRVREAGLQSQQIATVLEDFLDNDVHLGLVQKTTALGNAWKQDRARLDEAMQRARTMKAQLLQARKELADTHRSITQLFRNAPHGERRGLVMRLHEMKKMRGDLDVDIHAIDALLNRASRAHMAVVA